MGLNDHESPRRRPLVTGQRLAVGVRGFLQLPVPDSSVQCRDSIILFRPGKRPPASTSEKARSELLPGLFPHLRGLLPGEARQDAGRGRGHCHRREDPPGAGCPAADSIRCSDSCCTPRRIDCTIPTINRCRYFVALDLGARAEERTSHDRSVTQPRPGPSAAAQPKPGDSELSSHRLHSPGLAMSDHRLGAPRSISVA